MKHLSHLSTRLPQQATGTPALLSLLGCLALGFTLVTTGTSVAQGNPNGCPVCHKQRQTIFVPCPGGPSKAYERHLAHGDSPGACTASQIRRPRDSKTQEVSAKASSAKVVSKATVERVQRAVE